MRFERTRHHQPHFPADHVRDCALRRHLRARSRRDPPAIPEDRHFVGDLEDFLEAVAHEEDRNALVAQVSHKLEQHRRFMSRQRCGRLIHDQHPDVQRDRLGDFHRLLRGERQAARRAAHVEHDAQRAEDSLGFAEHPAPVGEGAAILVSNEYVLGDVEVGKEQRFLIDGGDAVALRFRRAGHRYRRPGKEDVAAIRLVDARHDLDQRRLAGAVLAEQRVDLAGMERERHVVQRLRGAEALGDAAELKDGPRRHSILPPALHFQYALP